MPALTERIVAEVVRGRLGLDASHNARIIFQIPTALEQLARKVAANPRKRPLLTTLRRSTEIALTANAIDLEAHNQTAAKKLLLEYLHCGKLFYGIPDSRTLTGVQCFLLYDLFYKAGHGLLNGEAFQFPAALPGGGTANGVTYYVVHPTQAELNATGFLGAVPADYFKIATSLANVQSRTCVDVTFNQPSLTLTTNGGDVDVEPVEPVDPGLVNTIENHPFYGDYRFFWKDGSTLRVIGYNKSDFLPGLIRFAVPYQPTLTQLSGIPELHGEFFEKMAELCAGVGNDAAEDGEH